MTDPRPPKTDAATFPDDIVTGTIGLACIDAFATDFRTTIQAIGERTALQT